MVTVAIYLSLHLLEKLRYYRTGGYDDAEYPYDDMARLVQLDD